MSEAQNRPTHHRQLTAAAARMQAITQVHYGEPEEVLTLATIDRPSISDSEVLLRVRATGVDRGASHLITGLPYPVRLASGLGAPRAHVPGREVAGRVEAVGPEVTTLQPGDDVLGIADGGSRYDVILDIAGNRPLKSSFAAPSPRVGQS